MSLIPNPLPSHSNPNDRDEAIIWARNLLNEKNFVIVDTETTGFTFEDEVIQIGMIDHAGNVLMDTLVKPLAHTRMPKRAQEVHGISMKMLKKAPTFGDVYSDFLKASNSRIVVCYNSQFDIRLLQQSTALVDSELKLDLQSDCAMLAYSKFIGAPNRFNNGYAWQRLPRLSNKDHRAVDDCLLTLELIRNVAETPLQGESADFKGLTATVLPALETSRTASSQPG